jgi:hypothetical protein
MDPKSFEEFPTEIAVMVILDNILDIFSLCYFNAASRPDFVASGCRGPR